MSRKKLVILPKLYDAKGNLLKKWFVFYSVLNPRTGKMERFRVFEGLNEPDETIRRTIATNTIEKLTTKLKRG